MGFFQKFKAGLQKTQARLAHELKRIFSGSPKLTGSTIEELESALIGADFGMAMTTQIVAAVRRGYESQGRSGLDVFAIARREVEQGLSGLRIDLAASDPPPAVVSLVGVNGTGKTTTAAKLAHRLQGEGRKVALAACDTFRAAAIEQIKLWGQRLGVPVVAGNYGADPASVAHDALSAAMSKRLDYLFVDTAGRLHTKHNLMQELQKVHRVMAKVHPGAPHEVLLVLDATTGMNALSQAREFHRAVSLTGLVVTKLDGTSKGGMVVAIQRELGLPIKFVGLGEKAEDLQPFSPAQFAAALFGDEQPD
ncbi:MAG TPA: signal recognition particle-docking protein FtsY [Candidatus Paceibacterota bacterium]|nr:signal recognition particle-docking protein FtsY [Verrucomicrobiota bacterium]HOX02085.1 signal recognition particle-docking protein FtsY [Verrucomicrobiota bacterium]HRZ45291.1 signal recognition particle-docking protein FtsY [Candidatus Paceibacterota bacterium]HRZ91554.1 signal recognition particle-docking protein FtsY [Candidatus Paceibacterota bacterium]